jgi:hypothetical protein
MKHQFLALAFAAAAEKTFRSRNLAGALNTDGAGCTLSVDQEVKTDIPVNNHPRSLNGS